MKRLLIASITFCSMACQSTDISNENIRSQPDLANTTHARSEVLNTSSQYPRELTASERSYLSQHFPSLNLNLVKVTAESSSQYNCIAYSMGLTNTWINPDADLSNLMLQYYYAHILYVYNSRKLACCSRRLLNTYTECSFSVPAYNYIVSTKVYNSTCNTFFP